MSWESLMDDKRHTYRTYIIRREGKTVFTGSSTACAKFLGISQATFYNYARYNCKARGGIEIETLETTGKYACGSGKRPCDGCPREKKCYLTSCEAYRRWFSEKWRGIQTAYRRMYLEARKR